MRLSVADVLARLTGEGLAPPGADVAAREALAPELADELPSYMRAAVAAGAWLATIFLLSSLFAITGLRDEGPASAVGVVLMGAGIFMRRAASTEFFRWAAVALCLAGLGMLTFGVGGLTDSAFVAALVCLFASIALLWLVNDTTLRLLCTLTGGSSLFVGLVTGKVPYAYDVATALVVIGVAYVWRSNLTKRSDALADMLAPIGYGLVVVLFAALLGRTLATSANSGLGREVGSEIGTLGPFATIVCTAALVWLAFKVLDEHGASLSNPASFAALGGAAVLGAITLDSPGIAAGVAMLALAFDRRNRVLLGMAAVFLVVFASFYYYSLHLTLLEKSGVLVGSGLLLLGVRSKVVSA